MRFCSLASSSKAGSAYLVEGGDGTRLLVDCGLGIRKLEARLWQTGVGPASLAGVLATHGHADHVAALRLRHPFTAKHRVPLYATGHLIHTLTYEDPQAPYSPRHCRHLGETHAVRAGRPFKVGGLEVTAFRKPHDAPDPLGFLITDGEAQIAVLTDLGTVYGETVRLLRGSTFLVFESNHDVEMELRSGRPGHLIRRVLGNQGHLSNEQAGKALAGIVGPETKMILLAHLSDECNTPELAYGTVVRHLDQAGYGGGLGVAPLFGRSCAFTEEHAPRLPIEATAGLAGDIFLAR